MAIASRVGLDDVATSFPGQPAWAAKPEAEPTVEARALGATVGVASGARPVRLWSLYVPNGRELTHPHYTYKLDWLRAYYYNISFSYSCQSVCNNQSSSSLTKFIKRFLNVSFCYTI